MPTPTGITTFEPNIIVEEGVLVFIDKIGSDYSYASVRQTYSGATKYVVDDAIVFRKADAVWFVQEDNKFYVVDDTKILFKMGVE